MKVQPWTILVFQYCSMFRVLGSCRIFPKIGTTLKSDAVVYHLHPLPPIVVSVVGKSFQNSAYDKWHKPKPWKSLFMWSFSFLVHSLVPGILDANLYLDRLRISCRIFNILLNHCHWACWVLFTGKILMLKHVLEEKIIQREGLRKLALDEHETSYLRKVKV